jgi:exodeoxyribonuclease VII small subunit
MSEEVVRSFEDSLGDLERIVRDLEDGQLGLDESLARYEQGVALIRHCQAQLTAAEQRILMLTGVGADGEPALSPFGHEATAAAAASAMLPATNNGTGRVPKERKRRPSEY